MSDCSGRDSCNRIVNYFKKLAEIKGKEFSDEVLLYVRALAYADTVHDFRGDRNKFGELRSNPDQFLTDNGYWDDKDISDINDKLSNVIHLGSDNRIPSLSKWENGLVSNIEKYICSLNPSDTCGIFRNHHIKGEEPYVITKEQSCEKSKWDDIKKIAESNLSNNQPVIIELGKGGEEEDEESGSSTKSHKAIVEKNQERSSIIKAILCLVKGDNVSRVDSAEGKLNFFLDCDALGLLKYYVYNKVSSYDDRSKKITLADKVIAVYRWGIPQTLDKAGRSYHYNGYREYLGVDTEVVDVQITKEQSGMIEKKNEKYFVKLPGIDDPELWITANLQENGTGKDSYSKTGNGQFWFGSAYMGDNKSIGKSNMMVFRKDDYILSVDKLSTEFRDKRSDGDPKIEKNIEYHKDSKNVKMKLGKVFDLKRMMDWYQVIFMYLFDDQINGGDGYSFFVTYDILAAAFARLLNIPCILEKPAEMQLIIFPGKLTEVDPVDSLKMKGARLVSDLLTISVGLNELKEKRESVSTVVDKIRTQLGIVIETLETLKGKSTGEITNISSSPFIAFLDSYSESEEIKSLAESLSKKLKSLELSKYYQSVLTRLKNEFIESYNYIYEMNDCLKDDSRSDLSDYCNDVNSKIELEGDVNVLLKLVNGLTINKGIYGKLLSVLKSDIVKNSGKILKKLEHVSSSIESINSISSSSLKKLKQITGIEEVLFKFNSKREITILGELETMFLRGSIRRDVDVVIDTVNGMLDNLSEMVTSTKNIEKSTEFIEGDISRDQDDATAIIAKESIDDDFSEEIEDKKLVLPISVLKKRKQKNNRLIKVLNSELETRPDENRKRELRIQMRDAVKEIKIIEKSIQELEKPVTGASGESLSAGDVDDSREKALEIFVSQKEKMMKKQKAIQAEVESAERDHVRSDREIRIIKRELVIVKNDLEDINDKIKKLKGRSGGKYSLRHIKNIMKKTRKKHIGGEKIIIKNDGKTEVAEVERSATLYEVRKKLAERQGIPPDQQILIFSGKEEESGLKDKRGVKIKYTIEDTISEYGKNVIKYIENLGKSISENCPQITGKTGCIESDEDRERLMYLSLILNDLTSEEIRKYNLIEEFRNWYTYLKKIGSKDESNSEVEKVVYIYNRLHEIMIITGKDLLNALIIFDWYNKNNEKYKEIIEGNDEKYKKKIAEFISKEKELMKVKAREKSVLETQNSAIARRIMASAVERRTTSLARRYGIGGKYRKYRKDSKKKNKKIFKKTKKFRKK